MRKRASMPVSDVDALRARARAAGIGAVRMDAGGRTESLLTEVRAELTRIGNNASTRTAELTRRLEALEAHNQDVTTEIRRLQDMPRGPRAAGPTLGSQIAGHDALKRLKAEGLPSVRMTITTGGPSESPPTGVPAWSENLPEFVPLARQPVTVRALLPQLRTTATSVRFRRQILRSNAAAPVAEGATKPESNYAWEAAEAPVRVIAHWVQVSRQAMDDVQGLEQELDLELRYGLAQAEEAQLLKGSGVGENLSGLVTEATAFSAPFSINNPTMLDTLLLAICQLTNAGYMPTGVVLHPTDYFRMLAIKDQESRYIAGSPLGQAARVFWQLPVALSLEMDEDQFLVGAFSLGATVYDRMDVEVLISSEHGDNFTKNELTVRAEQRLALAIKRPAALVTGDFGNVSG